MFFASFANASKKQILSDIFQAALEFQRFCEFNYGFIALPADLCYADNGNSEALASAKASVKPRLKPRHKPQLKPQHTIFLKTVSLF